MASFKKFLRQEDRRESQVTYRLTRYRSYAKALRANQARESYPSKQSVKDRKGNILRWEDAYCHEKELVNRRTWLKFIEDMGLNNENILSFTQSDELGKLFMHWITSVASVKRTFSDKWQHLDAEGMIWLRQRCIEAAEWNINVNKCEGWIKLEDKHDPDADYWANEDLCRLNVFLHTLRTNVPETVATLANKAVEYKLKCEDSPQDEEIQKQFKQVRMDLIEILVDALVDVGFFQEQQVQDIAFKIEAEWQRIEQEQAERNARKRAAQ